MSDLDQPVAAGDLYLARGADVEVCRPVLTGDVYERIAIPGVDDDPGMAIVLAHPCSMRQGPHLRSHVQMARVSIGAGIPLTDWSRGHFGVMPLPGLSSEDEMVARATFELAGRVPTGELSRGTRIACLDSVGITLLLQRLVFSLTRFAVPLDRLHESIAHVLEEADLLEDWIRARLRLAAEGTDQHEVVSRAEIEFDDLMGRDNGALRKRLLDRMQRPAVRRAVLSALHQGV